MFKLNLQNTTPVPTKSEYQMKKKGESLELDEPWVRER